MSSRVLLLEDLAAIREQSQPLTGAMAPTTSSEVYKSKRSVQQPRGKDFQHRFNLETRLREPATLKAAGAGLTSEVVSLATGRPSPEYYPFSDVLSCGFVVQGKETTQTPCSPNALSVALSYGYSQGSEANVRFLTEHTELVHDPPYSNWEVCMTAGSTSAIEHALRMFCSRGEYVLMEEQTYSGTLEAMKPLGLQCAAIRLDEEGMSADDLESVLSGWDRELRGGPKPFLLYTIPTGQNPTGLTQTARRRQQIYAVAERHDLFIIEDDPYYYMHYPLEDTTTTASSSSSSYSPEDRYLQNLPPSYLSMDVSGRVMRLDSTSKMLAPGLRCGWMTANSEIIAKILSHHDVGIVCPSGVAQLLVSNLLDNTWGHRGFARWLMYLRDQYALRCRTLVRACEDHLPRELCSWRTPEAGMFLWIQVDWRKHPMVMARRRTTTTTLEKEVTCSVVEERIYATALSKGALICKGSAFQCQVRPVRRRDDDDDDDDDLFLRLTFASASFEEMVWAVQRLGAAIREEFFGVEV